MGVVVACKSCGKRLSIPAKLFEQRVRGRVVTIHCKSCGELVRVDGTIPPPPNEEDVSEGAAPTNGAGAHAFPKPGRLPRDFSPPKILEAPMQETPSEVSPGGIEFVKPADASGFEPVEEERDSFSHATGPISVRKPTATIGRYGLFGQFAIGGMATVHFGRLDGAGGFSRVVAIKRLLPHLVKNQEFIEMLLKEARLAARVRHPNVVPTLDVVASKGDVLLVMEYVHGESLSALCRKQAKERREPIAVEIAVRIMLDVLHGLHAVHEATDERGHSLGLIHRDVSPQNVIVGNEGVSRVLDFGVAKAVEQLEETLPNKLKGKSGYMSPEQIRGERLTRRSDMFAAGIVLWELLTLRRLFAAESESERMEMIKSGNYPRPSEYRPEISPELDEISMRALAFAPEDRYPTMLDLAEALEKAARAASSRTVADWVNSLAQVQLTERARMLAQVENWTGGEGPIELSSSPFSAETAVASPLPLGRRESVSGLQPPRELLPVAEPVDALSSKRTSALLIALVIAIAGLIAYVLYGRVSGH